MFEFLIKNNIGEYASILGLLVTLIGFAITLYNVNKSKKASELSQTAVSNMRKDLARSETVIEVSSVINSLDEIRRIHRLKNWSLLFERYTTLRRSLVSIKTNYKALTKEQKSIIQSTIQNIKSIEDDVELALLNNTEPKGIDRINKIVADHTDRLYELLIEIKNTGN